MRTACCAILTMFLAAACSSSVPTYTKAEAALAAGDYDRATALYRAAMAEQPADPLTAEKADLARRRALESHLAAARRAERDYDLTLAAEELRLALDYATDPAPVEAERKKIDATETRIGRQVSQARALLASSRDREAYRILSPIGLYSTTFPEITELLGQAQKTAAAEDAAFDAAGRREVLAAALAGSEDAAAAGHVGEALAVLLDARSQVGDDPALATAEKDLRRRVSAELRTRAVRATGAGHPATGALLSFAADAYISSGLGRYRPRPENAPSAFTNGVRTTLRIEEFVDTTGGRADPVRFRRALLAALEESPPGPYFDYAAERAAFIVTGEIGDVKVEAAPPAVTREVHEFVREVEQELNPAHSRARERVNELAERKSEAEEVYEAVKAERDEVEGLESRATIRANGTRFFGPYNQAAYYRILANVRRRESGARRYRDQISAELDQARLEADRVPPLLEREVLGRYPYEVRVFTKTASAAALIEFASSDPKLETMAFETRSGRTFTDRVIEGDPAVGLPADPADMPADPVLANEALDEVARNLAKVIGEMAMDRRRQYIREARELETIGDDAGSIDRYAAFLLTAGSSFALEQANAAERVNARFGIHVLDGTIDVRELRLD